MDTTTRSLIAATFACVVGVAAGCRGDRTQEPPRQFFPDLDDAPKWNPQTHSEFFADGRTMRQPPEHAVAFGRQPFVPDGHDWAGVFAQQRADLLKENPGYYTGKDGDKYLETSPVAFTEADLLRGQERYNIYCGVCHGYEGDGQGMVGKQWATPVPSFHDPKYLRPDMTVTSGHEGHAHPTGDQYKDGYLFFTARNGVPGGTPDQPDWVKTKMPGYKHALSVEDTWRVIAYIRALQQSHNHTIDSVPEADRARVREQMGKADAAVPAPTPAATPPATTTPAATTPATGGGK